LRAKRSDLLRSTHPYPSPTPYPLYPPLPLRRRGGEEGTNAKPEIRRYDGVLAAMPLSEAKGLRRAATTISRITTLIREEPQYFNSFRLIAYLIAEIIQAACDCRVTHQSLRFASLYRRRIETDILQRGKQESSRDVQRLNPSANSVGMNC
jgi:hypothetical protein